MTISKSVLIANVWAFILIILGPFHLLTWWLLIVIISDPSLSLDSNFISLLWTHSIPIEFATFLFLCNIALIKLAILAVFISEEKIWSDAIERNDFSFKFEIYLLTKDIDITLIKLFFLLSPVLALSIFLQPFSNTDCKLLIFETFPILFFAFSIIIFPL